MKQVLIAYATKTFTTKEYAEHIGLQLQSAETAVDVLPMSVDLVIDNYDIVILGAPINGMNWMPEATQFAKQHKTTLASKKVYCFFVSYVHSQGRPMWTKLIDKSMQSVAKDFKPMAIARFGGKVDKAMPKLVNWMFGMNGKALHFVNLQEATAWAEEIKQKL